MQLEQQSHTLSQRGQFADAVPLAQQVVEIHKQVLGETHPHYATSLNNLAELHKSQGDYAKAEPLCRQALEIDKRALGESHPNYAASLNNLAVLY
jgi:tetratricopeptide (TPR) repeat protein